MSTRENIRLIARTPLMSDSDELRMRWHSDLACKMHAGSIIEVETF